jgi:SpoVK/Ycf46/Vps4 family AAA+-type ATPase
MSDYNKFREVIIDLCKEKRACEGEFQKLIAATDMASFIDVLKANFEWCCDNEVLTGPIIGREKETRTLIEILCRRLKPNVIIVGEPGVGKKALVEGFAYEIINGNVPLQLNHAVLLELDTSLLFAGTSYKGEIEDRLKKVINECKRLNKGILFIDEAYSLARADDDSKDFGKEVMNNPLHKNE